MAALEAVVDSSVIVKWFLPEPLRPEAVRLLRGYQENKVRLMAPAIAIAEVSNVLCKRARRGQITSTAALHAYRLLNICAPALIADAELMEQAVRLALTNGQAVYDCLYLALALRRGCEMITADGKFHGVMSQSFPMILRL